MARGPNWHEPRLLEDEERERFLTLLRERCQGGLSPSNKEVCLEADVHRADVQLTREKDKQFGEDYRNARGYGVEQLTNAFVEEAIIGKKVPIVSAGKIVRDDDGNILYEHKRSERLIGIGLGMYTPEGIAQQARKLGIEISGPEGGPIPIQSGVSFADVAKVLQAAGKMPELEAPEGTGEVTGEYDEPADSGVSG